MSRRFPEIFIERNDSDMPNSLQPTREFWRYLFAGMAMQALQPQYSALNGTDYELAREATASADTLLAELEREKGEGDG